ncbi:MAG: hypothetical protein Q8P41_24960 [Pseudomonadota bacterium]|nr:hypothetical protein [Pseudomonadota bacterium]
MEGTATTAEDGARAEEVRAWLVQLRGGAPFLSAADGKLLADWLDARIPVPTILHGIEVVAERRRARRTRTPFTLLSCRGTVEKLARSGGGWRVPADLRAALAPADSTTGGSDVLVAEALASLGALPMVDPEIWARAACAVLRDFHTRVWDSLPPDERATILADAAADLAPLNGLLGEDGFLRACEEHARDRVRARYPTLSATRVWEEFGLGVA